MWHGICQGRPGDLGARRWRFCCMLHLGHNKLPGLVALNAGIALATLFRFWFYRRFVWVTSHAGRAAGTGGPPGPADCPPLTTPSPIAVAHAGTSDCGRKRDALRLL